MVKTMDTVEAVHAVLPAGLWAPALCGSVKLGRSETDPRAAVTITKGALFGPHPSPQHNVAA